MEGAETMNVPWVSFCMSTYKRPMLLHKQLVSILRQSFKDFEVVISDNDPERSAEEIVAEIGDPRLKYFANTENLGMIKSFNKSIERSQAKYIVMITDDDPVVEEMLEEFYAINRLHGDFDIYCGCDRLGKKRGGIETFPKEEFVFQLLHPQFTTNILWSSCIIQKDALLKIGGVPDYGSPHLADHAMLALCGGLNGGLMINKMFSQLTSHDANFSKSNIELYYVACDEFYKLMRDSFPEHFYLKSSENALVKHLERWFITYSFSLRRYFTYNFADISKLKELELVEKKVMRLSYMREARNKYFLKMLAFYIKKPLFYLGIMR